MSADLLAEFGQGSRSAQSSAGQPQTARSQIHPSTSNLDPSNDIFFDASLNSSSSKPQLSDPAGPQSPHAAQTPRQQPFDFQPFDLPRQDDSDILFDATIGTPAGEEEDEWGEFEGPEATALQDQPQQSTSVIPPQPSISAAQPQQAPQVTGASNLLDLLSLDDPAPSPTQAPSQSQGSAQQISKQPPEPTWDDDSFGDWGEFTDGHPTTTAPAKPAPPQPTWEDDSFGDWGDFTDGPAPAPAPRKAQAKQQPASPGPSPRNFTSTTPASPPDIRPTNIPPPSVLLDLLINLMNNLQKEAATAKRQTPPNPETASKIHNTLQTASHIIAGRTLRWKRDSILSQSMRIGPARSGKPGGMKLSAVNKHEDVKEEQDAVDVLALWRERAALFNAIIQAAGLRPIPPVPDPSALKVVTARLEQGGLKAGHACALCALRRDERVLKVDEGVQDSFGEWWTEHWGHTACRVFWERNSRLLGQR